MKDASGGYALCRPLELRAESQIGPSVGDLGETLSKPLPHADFARPLRSRGLLTAFTFQNIVLEFTSVRRDETKSLTPYLLKGYEF